MQPNMVFVWTGTQPLQIRYSPKESLCSGILCRDGKILVANLILKYYSKRLSKMLEVSPKTVQKVKCTVCPWYPEFLVISFQLYFSTK